LQVHAVTRTKLTGKQNWFCDLKGIVPEELGVEATAA
jgi:hypothetical protein